MLSSAQCELCLAQGFTLWLTLGFFIYFLVRLCAVLSRGKG